LTSKVPDPKKLLKGNGTTVRHIRLEDENTLDRPAVRELIARALKHAVKPLDPATPRKMIIKSISAKQRPRRPKGL
jgi:hypothetical protein